MGLFVGRDAGSVARTGLYFIETNKSDQFPQNTKNFNTVFLRPLPTSF